ncbi:winged helix-turn-helix transcriptional regulator [Methanococcus aeolicus]|uniref:winged helix-turn-helix transcriptional regulator n=1 Tax=Methanococcus aeolicus TaxID=42879 RepID=UPI0021C573D5|nr:winged helix-turn-helix transcriptional regulator [Methanococcus aeolicus]UXM84818.1 winged helix-turn-helix transcriptional regulator [Methanococcus aeolicus]
MTDKREFLKTLSKKNNFLVLNLLLNRKRLHFANIKRILKIDGRTLTDALNELMDYRLVKKEIENPNIRTSKVYYSLTDFGKKAVQLYDYAEQLEQELEEKEKHSIIINGNVGNNNIIANIKDSNVSFKK